MRARRYQIIYAVIAIITLLSGGYYNGITQGALFVDASTGFYQDNNDELESSSAKIDEHIAYTEEIINAEKDALQQVIRGYNKKIESKNLLDCLANSYYSISKELLFINSNVMIDYHHDYQEVITRYIHKSDGKKKVYN